MHCARIAHPGGFANGECERSPASIMIRIAKGLLIAQIVASALLLPLLFNVPLEVGRVAQEARKVADHLSQQGSTADAAQATAVADVLHTWRDLLPVAMGVLSIAGVLIGLVGWQALNLRQKNVANKDAACYSGTAAPRTRALSFGKEMKQIGIAVIVAVVVCVFFGTVIFPQWKHYERLAHAGKRTAGKIVGKQPENHQSIRYEYTAAGKTYTGSSSASFGGLPPFAQIKVGDEVPVTYWPEDMSVSVPGDPSDLFSSWSGLLFGVLPVVSLIAGSAVSWRLRAGMQKSNA